MSFQVQGEKKRKHACGGQTSNKTFYSSYQTVIYSSPCSWPLQQLGLPGNLWFCKCGLFLLLKRGEMLKLNYVAHEENRRVITDICIETLSF